MRTRTLITVGTALFLCSILSAMQPSKAPKKVVAARQAKPGFSNIKIGEGIEVEFEYGLQLQVLSKNNQQDTLLNMMLLDDTLTITNLAINSDAPIHLKVVTPGLISIEKLDPLHGATMALNGKTNSHAILQNL